MPSLAYTRCRCESIVRRDTTSVAASSSRLAPAATPRDLELASRQGGQRRGHDHPRAQRLIEAVDHGSDGLEQPRRAQRVVDPQPLGSTREDSHAQHAPVEPHQLGAGTFEVVGGSGERGAAGVQHRSVRRVVVRWRARGDAEQQLLDRHEMTGQHLALDARHVEGLAQPCRDLGLAGTGGTRLHGE